MNLKNLKTFQQKKEFLLILLANALILFLVVLSVSTIVGIQNKIKENRYIGQDVERVNTISVSATGEIYAKPDLALINFGVKNEAKTVAQAMEENSEKMNAIISFIKEQGVDEKDLKTTNFSIYPRYEYRKDETGIYPYPPGKRVLVGYEINQSLQVKIRDMDKISSIIQGAADEGANQVGTLRFVIDNEDELKKQAREKAIKEVKEKAKELSSQLGVKIVKIVNFSESGTTPYYQSYRFLEEDIGMAKGEAPQIETGENKIEVKVTITYEIN